MHELSTLNYGQINQALNSPTVKCVTFNPNLPFGFHDVHYQPGHSAHEYPSESFFR